MQLTSGSKLQDNLFEITGNIATGGFSYIYTGTWHVKQNADVAGNRVTHVFQHPIVIKELFKNKLARRLSTGWVEWSDSDSEIIKRKTLSEARKLNAIDHPNVLKVYAAFEENNTVYIITKPVENAKVLADIQKLYIKKNDPETGRDELYDNPNSIALPAGQVNKYTRQLCDALSFVHQAGILHLDVKPDNILVDANDNIVLIDFGISVSLGTKKSSDFVAARTKHYSPPEQGTGKSTSLSYATDVYALGATVYVFLTGKEPPDYEEQVSGTEFLVLPSTLCSNASEYMDGVIMRAMDLNRNQRYQSVDEFYKAFTGEKEFNELLAKAQKQLQAKKPEQAKKILDQASGMVSNHSELEKLITQCNNAPGADRAQFEELVYEAEDLLYTGKPDLAKEVYMQALRIMPGDDGCNAKIKECERQIELHKTTEQYNYHIEQAKQNQARENYTNAISLYNKALSIKPGDTIARQGIDECNRRITDGKFDAAFSKANDFADNSNWVDAITWYKKALDIKPGNEACKDGIRRCEQQKQKSAAKTGGTDLITEHSLLAEAKDFMAKGKQSQAIKCLNSAIANFPPALEAKMLLQKIQRQEDPPKSKTKKIIIWSLASVASVFVLLILVGIILGPSPEPAPQDIISYVIDTSIVDGELGAYTFTGYVKNGSPDSTDGVAHWEAVDENGNHDKYEGSFTQGKLNGYGTLTKYSSNLVYKGDFENNQFTGEGSIETLEKTDKANGLIYGLYQFENNNVLKAGVKYEGSFINYQLDGVGRVYDINSKLLGNCRFSQDSFVEYISK